MDYPKCLVQLDEVLNYLNEKELNKIPKEIRDAIKKNKDKSYIWKYDVEKDLSSQNLDRKTIALLSYLNMEYLLNEKQKVLMQKIHMLNEQKQEIHKRKKYNPDNLFRNKK